MNGATLRKAIPSAGLILAGSFLWTAQSAEPLPVHKHVAPAAQATEVPAQALGLDDLEALALTGNPTLAQAAALIEASRGKAEQAGLCPNPIIGYVGDQIGAAGTAGEMQGAFIQQTLVTAGKLRLSRAKYSQEAYQAEIQALAQQLRVLNGVRIRYYEVLASQRRIELRRELLRNAEESLRTHKEMFNTGQANQADVLLSEVEVNRAKIALRTEENKHQALWEHLIAVVGAPDLPSTPLKGLLEPEGTPLDWNASLARLLQDSPEVQLAHAHVAHDQIALRREQVEPIPNITVQAATGYDFETSNAVAGVQVGFEIPLWDRNQGTIRQARADLARSYANITRVELSLRQRLADEFSMYRTALETVHIYRDASIPKATEAYEIQLDMYKKRRAPWLQVVMLEKNLLQVKVEYTQSLLELRNAEVAINGLLLLDGLSEPPGPAPGGHLEATPKPR